MTRLDVRSTWQEAGEVRIDFKLLHPPPEGGQQLFELRVSPQLARWLADDLRQKADEADRHATD